MPNPKDPEKFEAYRKKMSEIAKAKGYGKWMKGKKASEETIDKQKKVQRALITDEERKRRSDRAKKLGYGKWMKGKTIPAEVYEKIAKHRRGKTYIEIYGSEERAQEEIQKRREAHKKRREKCLLTSLDKHDSAEYSAWRLAVMERDNYTCRRCQKKSGKDAKVSLQAHHIRPWSYFPNLRYSIDNGVVLCKVCHLIIHRHLRENLCEYLIPFHIVEQQLTDLRNFVKDNIDSLVNQPSKLTIKEKQEFSIDKFLVIPTSYFLEYK